MKLSVKGKLGGGFAALLILTGFVGWTGLRAAEDISQETRDIVNLNVLALAEASTTVSDATRVRELVQIHAFTKDPAEQSRLEAEVAQLDGRMTQHFATLRTQSASRLSLDAIAALQSAWDSYTQVRDQVLAFSSAGQAAEARATNSGAAHTRFEGVLNALDELIAVKRTTAEDRLDEAMRSYAANRNLMLAVMAIAVLLGAAIAAVLSRRILRAVREFSTLTSRVGEGDLAARVSLDGRDELGTLAENLNSMVVDLGELSGQVRDGAQSIGSATSEILAAVSQHTASATEQSAAINETSATVNEIRAAAEQSARKAKEVAEQAQASVQVSDEGSQAVGAIGRGMEEIREKVEAMARDILALSEQTQQIGEITATVNDLADQSNILALNAGIEAAKAGEQGKGFAVVAGEVRSLAEQSKEATAQIRGILGDIQKATTQAVLATERGTKVVEEGLVLGGRAGELIGSLAETIRQAAQAAQLIAASAHQQSVGMDQIAEAMKDVNEATTQFVAGAQQSQRAAEDLNDLARRLTALTERYRL